MKDYETGLTAERVRELLSYDPETGVLLWKVSQGAAKAGSVAGNLNNTGYRRIKIAGRLYLSHRLSWVHAYGGWPRDQLDHANAIRDDNRISNLREATRSENLGNQRRAQSSNKTGLLGVSWRSANKKFCAHIDLNGERTTLGLFNTAEEAHQAYLKAKRELHSHCTI